MASTPFSSAIALTLTLLSVAFLTAPTAATWCKPGCRAKQNYNKYDCPWYKCRFRACTHWQHGKKRYGWVCKPYKPSTPPPPTSKPCAEKCLYKWVYANKGCNKSKCKVSGCKIKHGKYGWACKKKATTPPPPKKCKDGCYVKWIEANKGCNRSICKPRSCKLPSGRYGFSCQPLGTTPPPPPPPPPPPSPKKCANKCYQKWRDANKGCDKTKCKIKGCPLGNGRWGFRCVDLPVTKPSPSPSPSPVPAYPPYCPTKCRINRKRVTILCNPAKCVVKGCTRKYGGYGWRCIPIPPTPSPTPSVTPSPSPQPKYPPYCPVVCRRNWRRVYSVCNPAECKVVNCRNPLKWWKWGYRCIPKKVVTTTPPTTTKAPTTTTKAPTTTPTTMAPTTTTKAPTTTTPAPTTTTKGMSPCENICYKKWRKAKKGCNPKKCAVMWCGHGKGYRCGPIY